MIDALTTAIIDTAWHPLANGCPPDWASGWGQDRYGVFVEFTLLEVAIPANVPDPMQEELNRFCAR